MEEYLNKVEGWLRTASDFIVNCMLKIEGFLKKWPGISFVCGWITAMLLFILIAAWPQFACPVSFVAIVIMFVLITFHLFVES